MSFSFIIATIFTRFFGINWGGGFFFHPDENNMATALSGLSLSSLNPHFFAYGQFPLYLGYLTLNLFGFDNSFANSVIILRLYSAIFSSLAVFIFFLISKRFTSRPAIPTWLFIFTPGLIQLAHFGTTESLLILVFLSNIYLSLKIAKNTENNQLYLLAAIISGLGIATKISALIFILPIIIVGAKKPDKLFLYTILSLIFSFIFSPYNLISAPDFVSSMRYETQVAVGQLRVFYTTQFKDTVPYFFQFTHIFPYISGLPIFILSIVGSIFLLITNYKLLITKDKLLILLPVFLYLLYFGQLYTKWSRFMSPIFFVFPLLAGIFISRVRFSFFRVLLVLLSVLPGIYFMALYYSPDSRLLANQWLNQNTLNSQKITSESGNVVNLPEADYYHDFYQSNQDELPSILSTSDYIIVPSRRVFKNGIMSTYYQKLFSGELGFVQVKEFGTNFDLFLNSESAEETWSVFDRPTIRIYKKTRTLSANDYAQIIQP